MPKGKIAQDTFEQLAELGVSTVKKSAKQVKQTFDPLTALDTASEEDKTQQEMKQKAEEEAKKNHTPLDFRKLEDSYKKQDSGKEAELKAKLFQLVKGGEKKAIGERKSEEQQRLQGAMQEEQQKKKEEEEKRKADEQTGLPQGKVRRSIFSPKKVAKREQVETRAASGKQ